MPELDALLNLIRGRRTHKRFNGAAVSAEQLHTLVEVLRWAPNHRLTQPWRVAVLDQAACRELAQWMEAERETILAASDKPEKDRSKIDKVLAHYVPSFGAVIQVAQVVGDHPQQDWEDHAAVCAGVQNLLLCAEAMGLAHFWSSTALLFNPVVMARCGLDPATQRMVASIWLGGRVDEPHTPARLAPEHYSTWIGSPQS